MDLTPWMTRWHMLPEKGGVILCAVSGGRDSICLLDYLHTLGQERGFTAAAGHLNHLMRPTAQRDEDFVRSFCARRGIPFYTERADVYALCGTWGLTVEETGRRARYEFLQRTAETIGAEKIATAHHQNDLAETVLLQLLRGTGPQGLTGIPPVRGNIVRPLLDTPRRDIERYIAEHELAYVTDETNGDTAYARNRLRLEIWPELEGINPRAAEHIACTADILRRENAYLDALAAERLRSTGTGVDCEALLAAPEALRPRMLRLLLDRLPTGLGEIMRKWIGIIGGYLTGVLLLGVNEGAYFHGIESSVLMPDVTEGFIKSFVFALLIALICCYQGYNAHRRRDGMGPEAVANATTSAVVISCVFVLVADYVVTSAMLR